MAAFVVGVRLGHNEVGKDQNATSIAEVGKFKPI